MTIKPGHNVTQVPQTPGFQMCERDFKIVTCKVTQADAVEDLKMDPATMREVAWAGPELKLVGVYKDGGPGALVACADQPDATANGILTIWDYCAYDQADGTTLIKYDVRSGAIVYDPAIPAAERFAHRAYVVIAPGLGQANWVRLYDGYLCARPNEGELSTESPSAKLLDPDLAPGANVVRVYVVHPQGQSNAHVLWLLTYRPHGSA